MTIGKNLVIHGFLTHQVMKSGEVKNLQKQTAGLRLGHKLSQIQTFYAESCHQRPCLVKLTLFRRPQPEQLVLREYRLFRLHPGERPWHQPRG